MCHIVMFISIIAKSTANKCNSKKILIWHVFFCTDIPGQPCQIMLYCRLKPSIIYSSIIGCAMFLTKVYCLPCCMWQRFELIIFVML